MGLNPYKAVNAYTVVYDHWTIKIITRDKLDVMEWVVYLPKSLIQFILEQDLPSPLQASVLSLNEEVWCLMFFTRWKNGVLNSEKSILYDKIKNSSWLRKLNH